MKPKELRSKWNKEATSSHRIAHLLRMANAANANESEMSIRFVGMQGLPGQLELLQSGAYGKFPSLLVTLNGGILVFL